MDSKQIKFLAVVCTLSRVDDRKRGEINSESKILSQNLSFRFFPRKIPAFLVFEAAGDRVKKGSMKMDSRALSSGVPLTGPIICRAHLYPDVKKEGRKKACCSIKSQSGLL